MSTGLRPALLHPCFWPEVYRGSERIIREHATGLLEQGHEPRLITSHPGLPSRSVDDGLPVLRAWRPPEGALKRRGFDDYRTHVPFTYLALRAGHDDLAHAFYPTDALAAARWSQRTGKPAVLSIMGALNPWSMRYDAMTRAVRRSTAVTTLSRWVAEGVRERFGVEAEVIPPSVDLDAFAPGRRSEAPTIFCAGDPGVARKRVDMLARAFRRVRSEHPEARLQLMKPRGPVSDRELLESTEGIEWVDWTPRPEDLARVYASAWVMALPSYGEAFGVVLIESLACGTPVVGTDIDAFPEIVTGDGIGRLFADGDEDALGRALLEAVDLARDPETTERCRSRARDFSRERTTGAYVDLYERLLAG